LKATDCCSAATANTTHNMNRTRKNTQQQGESQNLEAHQKYPHGKKGQKQHKKELEAEIQEIRERNEGKKMSLHDRGALGMAERKLKSIEEEGSEEATFKKGGQKAGHTRHMNV